MWSKSAGGNSRSRRSTLAIEEPVKSLLSTWPRSSISCFGERCWILERSTTTWAAGTNFAVQTGSRCSSLVWRVIWSRASSADSMLISQRGVPYHSTRWNLLFPTHNLPEKKMNSLLWKPVNLLNRFGVSDETYHELAQICIPLLKKKMYIIFLVCIRCIPVYHVPVLKDVRKQLNAKSRHHTRGKWWIQSLQDPVSNSHTYCKYSGLSLKWTPENHKKFHTNRSFMITEVSLFLIFIHIHWNLC